VNEAGFGRWVHVCALDDVPRAGGVAVLAEGRALAVFRTGDGGLAAVADRCRHRFMPIHDGLVDDDVVECAYHGWRFDLRTGDLLTSFGAVRGIACYDARQIDGRVEVRIPPLS
jgi:nitrite reductase/ring-hydroxylating ferredoxin subunit